MGRGAIGRFSSIRGASGVCRGLRESDSQQRSTVGARALGSMGGHGEIRELAESTGVLGGKGD